MANPVCEVLLTDDALRPTAAPQDGSGAIVDFFGVVRPLEQDRKIAGIEYEAHRPMATYQIEKIAREALARFGLNSVIIRHRLSFVPAGEASVFVRTTSRNRMECYRANEWIMAELKQKVPIWKRPQFQGNPEVGKAGVIAASSP
jgi:molybdopterin synthase catalytic subunit